MLSEKDGIAEKMVLGIYGSGGAGRELRDIAELLEAWTELVFIDDTVAEGMHTGIKRMPFECFCRMYNTRMTEVVIAQGEPEYKIALYGKVKEKGYAFANLIHPSACISASTKLGRGVVVQAGAFISCDVTIEDNVHILQKAVIGHDCFIHGHCQISAGVTIGGRAEVGKGTFIGLNSSVKDEVKIGADVVIGMGSAVFRDIPENTIVLGNPARLIKHKDDSMVFSQVGAVAQSNSQNQGKIVNLEKYDNVFIKIIGIRKEELKGLKYKTVPSWNSMEHMWLIEEMESVFGFVMEANDIMDFDSYEKGKKILASHYGIVF